MSGKVYNVGQQGGAVFNVNALSPAPDSTVQVVRGATDAESGASLVAACVAAESLTPGGEALSAINPVEVQLPPGRYDARNLCLDAPYVRLAELAANSVRFRGLLGDLERGGGGVWQEPDRAAFARAGSRYWGPEVFVHHCPVKETRRFTNLPDFALVETGKVPIGESDRFVFVTEISTGNLWRVDKSTGAATAITKPNEGATQNMFGLLSGTLICSVTTTVYRSTDNGATWASVLTLGTGESAAPGKWSLAQANRGTIILPAYGTINDTGNTRKIYRSVDDGATWSTVHTENAGSAAGTIDHYHSACYVGYDVASKEYRWLASIGDGSQAKMLKSVDDGQNWTELLSQPVCPVQPVRMIPYGDGRYAVCASDAAAGVFKLDTTDGSFELLYTDQDRRSGAGYFFALDKKGETYYAGGFNNSGVAGEPVIVVSADGAAWVPYVRLGSLFKGVRAICGPVAGHLRLWCELLDGSYAHYKLNPATVYSAEARMVEPALLNGYAGNVSLCEVTTGWYTATAALSVDATEQYTGTGCVKSVGTAVAADTISTPTVNALTGETWVACLRLKAPTGKVQQFQCWINATSATQADGAYANITPTPGWQYAILPPIIMTEDTTLRISTTVYQDATDPATAYFDTIGFFKLSGGVGGGGCFNVGGAAKVAETISQAVDLPAGWTHGFALWPMMHSHYLAAGGGDHYIRTWKVDTDNYLSLFWDADDGKFKLQATIGGAAQTSIDTSAMGFARGQPIRLWISASASALKLSVQCGRAVETVSGAAMAGILSASVTVLSGNASGALCLPIFLTDATVLV